MNALQIAKDFLHKNNLDFLLINSTDNYLNEYNNLEQNSRYIITGFTGSTGDVLLTKESVHLFVDGRYHEQADNEVDLSIITVEKLGLGTSQIDRIVEIINRDKNNNLELGITSKKVSFTLYKKLQEKLPKIQVITIDTDPIEEFYKILTKPQQKLREINTEIAGKTSNEKVAEFQNKFKKENIDCLLITKLEEIAYISNLRGCNIPFSSSFKAKAILTESEFIIFTNTELLPDEIDKNILFKQEKDFEDYISSMSSSSTVGISEKSINLYTYNLLKEKNIKINNPDASIRSMKINKELSWRGKPRDIGPHVRIKNLENNFIEETKAKKTPEELSHLQNCFTKTDITVSRAITWLNQQLEKDIKVTEKDLSQKVKQFFEEEGALNLSFEVLLASGKNSSIIHYTNPSDKKEIQAGEIVLLDCGAYFEGGYATDITRTFLAKNKHTKPTNEQKTIYTQVLKSFLAGLNYPITNKTTGYDIDKKVREVVTKNMDENFKFSHGTGHGVGISVHEAPPYISPSELAKQPLKAGMCFTIEPGLYNPNWGGIRLENTVSVIKENGNIKIKSLSRAKFDESLIDYDKLDKQEQEWLENYQKQALK